MDPIITAGLITAGSSLLGNSMNVNAQNTANRENRELARENRDWQKMMSDTSHQREMKDLAAAGLNPILAAGGGASTPGGDSATMEAPQVQMPSVLEIAALNEQRKNNESLRNLQAAQAEQIRTQTKRGEFGGELGSDINKIYKRVKSTDLIKDAVKYWNQKSVPMPKKD